MRTLLLIALLAIPGFAQSPRRSSPVVSPTPAFSPKPSPSKGLSDSEALGGMLALIAFYGVLTLIGTAIYFIPTMIGWRKDNIAALFALNFLLGWTCAGWVGALVWALMKEKPRRVE
jgi:predicted benzoate:H+ symporter BenE